MSREKIRNRTILVATVVTALAFVGGWAMAAIVVTNGSESGAGNYTSANNLAYWTQASVGLSSVPNPVPATLSQTVATPTVLAAVATSYAINAPTIGDLQHFFKFTEATGAPANTEVEIIFTISTGGGPTITTVNIFIETQAAPPGTATTFTLEYDLGNPAAGSITLNSVQQVSQQCSAVGTCP